MAQEILELIRTRDEMEKEIKDNLTILQAEQDVGMTGSLVDSEQFPRVDIDIRRVRHARHRVVCLQNDHRAVMHLIEDKLHALHANADTVMTDECSMEVNGELHVACHPAFARLDRVDAGSPAALAGLQAADELVQFGSVSAANFNGMQSVAAVVTHSHARSVPMLIRRDGRQIRLTVTPNVWAGQGLLGW